MPLVSIIAVELLGIPNKADENLALVSAEQWTYTEKFVMF